MIKNTFSIRLAGNHLAVVHVQIADLEDCYLLHGSAAVTAEEVRG